MIYFESSGEFFLLLGLEHYGDHRPKAETEQGPDLAEEKTEHTPSVWVPA